MLESSGHTPKSRVENGNSIAWWSVLVMGTQQETKNMPVMHPDLSIMQLKIQETLEMPTSNNCNIVVDTHPVILFQKSEEIECL